jgi:transcriptional regulator with XRE-family HTH domain
MKSRSPAANTDPRVLFGKRLVKLRKDLGWSQEGLAAEAGIGRSYLSGVERGKRNIAVVNICKIAATLGIDPSEMLKFASD